jgi:hypothetical protein
MSKSFPGGTRWVERAGVGARWAASAAWLEAALLLHPFTCLSVVSCAIIWSFQDPRPKAHASSTFPTTVQARIPWGMYTYVVGHTMIFTAPSGMSFCGRRVPLLGRADEILWPQNPERCSVEQRQRFEASTFLGSPVREVS